MKRYLMVAWLTVLSTVLSLPGATAVARAASLLAQLETEIQKLAADLSGSVVTVRAIRTQSSGSELREVYVGTGVVFDSGWVITTSSVVASRAAYSIEAPGQVPVPADLAEYNEDGQMAVFRAPMLSAPPARFDEANRLVPGQMLLVMGNAYGVTGAVSWGVAAGAREDGTWQVGVGVSPGASGSPVVNTSGEVVGLISAALSDPQAPELMLFGGHTAVMAPVFPMLRMARQIVAEGHVGRAFLGIRPEPVDPALAHALGLSHGLLIGAVSFGSPAYSAGLQSGDVIVELAGRTIVHEEALRLALTEHCPGEEVTMSVVRNQRVLRLPVVLGQLPEVLPSRPAVPPVSGSADLSASIQAASARPELESEIRKLEERLAELKAQGERP